MRSGYKSWVLALILSSWRPKAHQVWSVGVCSGGGRGDTFLNITKWNLMSFMSNVMCRQKRHYARSLLHWAARISGAWSLMQYFSDCLLMPCYAHGENGGSTWEFQKCRQPITCRVRLPLELLKPVLNDWYWYMVISLPDHMTQLPQESIKMNCTSAYVSDFFSLPGPVHTPMVQ